MKLIISLLTIIFSFGCASNDSCEVKKFAHRMKPSCSIAPENSIEALILSLGEGKSEIETDIQHTRDGVLIVNHNFVNNVDYSGQFPLFTEVVDTLDSFGYKNTLLIDIKDQYTMEQALYLKSILENKKFKYKLLYFPIKAQEIWDLKPVSVNLCLVFHNVYAHYSRQELCQAQWDL